MLDRLLKPFLARPVTRVAPPPAEIAPGLWALDRRVAFPGGIQLPIRSTIVRLQDGSLVVISPPHVDSAGAESIAALGPVGAIVAPNTYHYVFMSEFARRFAEATCWIAPGLRERVGGFPRARELATDQPDGWRPTLEYVVLRASPRAAEVVFFHLPSGSLIVTDLVFNLPRLERAIDRISWRLSGIPSGFGPGRTSRRLLLRDPQAVSRCLTTILRWPIQQIVVSHGDIVRDDARAKLQQALGKYTGPLPGS